MCAWGAPDLTADQEAAVEAAAAASAEAAFRTDLVGVLRDIRDVLRTLLADQEAVAENRPAPDVVPPVVPAPATPRHDRDETAGPLLGWPGPNE